MTCATDSSPVTSSARRSLRHRSERAQQKRRLADAGLAADEHERGGNEPAAEHPVELGHAGPDPRGLLGLDVDEPQDRLRRRLARRTADDVFHERAECVAAGTFPEPATGGVTAIGARVIDGRLAHRVSLGLGPDGERDDSGTKVQPRWRLFVERVWLVVRARSHRLLRRNRRPSRA